MVPQEVVIPLSDCPTASRRLFTLLLVLTLQQNQKAHTDVSGPDGTSWLLTGPQNVALQLLAEADKRQLCKTALNFAQETLHSWACSAYELASGHRLIRFDYSAVFTPCGKF